MVLVRTLQEIYFDFTAKAKELPFQFCDYKYYCCLPKAFFYHIFMLTTSVRRQSVPAGDLGSSAACKSQTLILLQSQQMTRLKITATT